MGKDAREIRRQIEETRSEMGDTVEALAYKSDVPARVKDKINERIDTVKGAIGGVKQSVGSAAGRAGNAVGNAAPNMSGVQSAARRGAGLARENPLGLALGALAVGLLGGLLVPVSSFERENVGPIRDDLLEKAQTIGADVIAHGKEVVIETAQAALQTAQESAQTHGRQLVDQQGDAQQDA